MIPALALIAGGCILGGCVAILVRADQHRVDAEEAARAAVEAAKRAEAARDAIVPPYREDARPASPRPALVAVSPETVAAIRAAACRNAGGKR